MSAEKVTTTRYRCKCELKDCPGKGKSWLSQDAAIPERCTFCGRRTWNGQDLRKSMFITAHGKTMRASQWAKETGISKQTIRYRLMTGWTEEDAVTIHPGKERP